MVRVYHDGLCGGSLKSAEHLKKHIAGVKPIEIRINQDGRFHFEFSGTRGEEMIIILESGLNCGYSGTGPTYSFEILQILGVPEDLASKVYDSSNLLYDFRIPNKPTVKIS